MTVHTIMYLRLKDVLPDDERRRERVHAQYVSSADLCLVRLGMIMSDEEIAALNERYPHGVWSIRSFTCSTYVDAENI